ncbi:MAG: imidazolonepropionase [Acidobacteria bacterium]|nr:imidazolonepropionase [Acidobacteriota bacterium]
MLTADFTLIHARELVCITSTPTDSKPWRGSDLSSLGIISDGALAARGGRIIWVGRTDELTRHVQPTSNPTEIDATGRVVTPGLVDAHTHPVFPAARADEFALRAAGKTYQEIAQAGGGIANSVSRTHSASTPDLERLARQVADRMLAGGTTTAEAKSGYGLNRDDELRMLRVIRSINEHHAIEWVPTAMPAHEVPAEFRSNPDLYVTLVMEEILPAIAAAGLAEFNDVFCEAGVFNRSQSQQIQTRARELGFGLKFHADELSDQGGAELAAAMGAISADHLVYISESGIAAMAKSETIAVMLPGTAYYLDLPRRPPVRRMIESGLAVALATDCNPGSNMTESMPLAMNQACVLYKMSPAEALVAATWNAACAIGRADRIGALAPGRQCDLVVWAVGDHRELAYHYGVNLAVAVIKKGRVVRS